MLPNRFQNTVQNDNRSSSTAAHAATAPRLIAFMGIFVAYPLLMGAVMLVSLACAQLFS